MIIDELWANAQGAKVEGPNCSWAASNQALHLLGKEYGMFRGIRVEEDAEEEAVERAGLDEEAVTKIKKQILDIAS